MPKFYCDYCDIYLAHSSIGGRRQHCIGRKHIQNKIDYYQKVIREQGFSMMPGIPGPLPPIPGGIIPGVFAGAPPPFPGPPPMFPGVPPFPVPVPFPGGIPHPMNYPMGMPPATIPQVMPPTGHGPYTSRTFDKT